VSLEPPDTQRLYVPLRQAACGVSLRLFRDRDGTRCAVGFTTVERLISTLGSDQHHYRLTESAVRALAGERGVHRLIVDPGLVAAPVSPVESVALAATTTTATTTTTTTPVFPVAPAVPVAASVAEPVGSSRSAWTSWSPELVGLLTVSAVTGAARYAALRPGRGRAARPGPRLPQGTAGGRLALRGEGVPERRGRPLGCGGGPGPGRVLGQ